MHIAIHPTARDFRARTQELLERQEAANNLMLGITDILIHRPERFPRFHLVSVEDATDLRVAALMTPPNNLILYSDAPDKEAMSILARHFFDQHIAVPGAIGMVEPVHTFAEAWTEIAGRTWSVAIHERAYELRQVIPPVGVPGQMVVAGPEHRGTIIKWWNAFVAEALPGAPQSSEAEEASDRHIADKNMYFWVVEGVPVSMAAGPNRRTRHGGTVGPVYTPPEKRGHGYASAVTAGVSQKILDSGKAFCMLFTDLANPISNRIYQKIGYRPVGDYDALNFAS